MEACLIIIGLIVLLLMGGTLIALWVAPEGEETENGFHAVGPSRYQRFRERLARQWKRRTRMGGWKHDPHP